MCSSDGFCYVMVLATLLTTTSAAATASFSPPYRNVALRRPVSVTPSSSGVCGAGERTAICRSFQGQQSVRACWETKCYAACPHLTLLPTHETLLSRIVGGTWPCVQRVYDAAERAPNASSDLAVRFASSAQPCYLEVEQNWMSQLTLQSKMSVTVVLWVFTDMATGSGTVFDIAPAGSISELKIVIDNGLLKILIGSDTYTRDTWIVPDKRWVHLGIQLHVSWASIFINGKVQPPAIYGIKYKRLNPSSQYVIGLSLDGGGPFVGLIQDFRIYMKSVSNRLVEQLATGRLPSVRVQDRCACPRDYPRLVPDAPKYCEQNVGEGRDPTQQYRLQQLSHPLEFANDGNEATEWVSVPGIDQVVLTIDLQQQYEVRHVSLLLYSTLPGLLTVERRRDAGSPWRTWQYYSQSCVTDTAIGVNTPLTAADDVTCKYLAPANTPIAYTSGRIVLDLLEGRPGQVDGVLSRELREFLQATSVRVTLKGHPYVNYDRHRYHSVKELTVNATCNCHGHGTACVSDPASLGSYRCKCAPDSNTQGDRCDVCTTAMFENEARDPYAPDFCQRCDCDAMGTVGGVTTACEQVGGQCECKPNVGGRTCAACVDGFYNLTAAGCRSCDCVAGAVPSNVTRRCDPVSGQCACRQNVAGLTCDRCLAGHYRRPDGDGCDPCACHANGSVSADVAQCDVDSGQCVCKTNVTGRACDTCVGGTYGLSPEQDACHACDCASDGATSSTCEAVSGQCPCRSGRHVGGRRCDACEDGWYAADDAEYARDGCPHTCACDVRGTRAGGCAHIGGACACLPRVVGPMCDLCATHAYGLDSRKGCAACACDMRRALSAACNVSTGACRCGPLSAGRACERCTLGAALLPLGGAVGCGACDCHPLGSQPNTTCDGDSGRCDCLPGRGDPAKGGTKCRPYIDSVVPTYGPKSGGTMITMRGGFLGNTTMATASIGHLLCHRTDTSGSAAVIVCLSSSLTKTSSVALLGQPQYISLTLAGDRQLSLEETFLYKKDPVITEVDPNRSIMGGGIVLRVTGMNFDSIAFPAVFIMMVYKGKLSEVFENDCSVPNATLMECPTPAVTLPVAMSTTMRRRRGADDTIAHAVNTAELRFYLGFRLDGVDAYHNMTSGALRLDELRVYEDPALERFDDDVQLYRPYWPYSHRYIVIKGDRLDFAATARDYNVTVGDEPCVEINLATNQITCTPPAEQPSPGEGGHRDGAPMVTVRVGNMVFVAGYLDYEQTFWENVPLRSGIIAGVIVAVVLIVLAVALVCWRRRRARKVKDAPPFEMGWTSKMSYGYATVGGEGAQASGGYIKSKSLLSLLPPELRQKLDSCLIRDSKRMVLGKVIGEGNFGRVHIGRLAHDLYEQPIPVAIKTLRENKLTVSEVSTFLEEATLMKDFKHEHVLGLTGVVIENQKAFVLLPYMENGDLKTFISKDDNMLTVGELIDYSRQISSGMVYLEEQHFVHRDLACRNCMISKDLIVKIADFGLSRDIYEHDYYKEGDVKRAMPVKWMALESLERGVFTSKSDVWSFGVLMWELLTRACLPYPDVDVFDMRNYLLCGNRMDRPDYAPDDIYALMLRCWAEEPASRPDFRQVKVELDEFLNVQNSKTQLRNKQRQQVPNSFRNSVTAQRPLTLLALA